RAARPVEHRPPGEVPAQPDERHAVAQVEGIARVEPLDVILLPPDERGTLGGAHLARVEAVVQPAEVRIGTVSISDPVAIDEEAHRQIRLLAGFPGNGPCEKGGLRRPDGPGSAWSCVECCHRVLRYLGWRQPLGSVIALKFTIFITQDRDSGFTADEGEGNRR